MVTFSDSSGANGYLGPLHPMVLNKNLLVATSTNSVTDIITSDVARTTHGTEPIRGTFTVQFRGFETVAVPFDVEASELERELSNLDSIDQVAVTRSESDPDGDGQAHGAYAWTVSFTNTMGDIPSLYPTPGRLTGGSVAIKTVVSQPGSAAVLVYDGSKAPAVKSFTATGLTTDALYAFKVVPINAVGRGVPTGATATVAARMGASPAQTTARGSAIAIGMAGVVHELQVISATDTDGSFALSLGGWYHETKLLGANIVGGRASAGYSAKSDHPEGGSPGFVATAAEMEAALEAVGTGIRDVHVTRSVTYGGWKNGSTGYAWTVTFIDPAGNVPLLRVNSTNITAAGQRQHGTGPGRMSTGMVEVYELLQGASNQFTVEPKKAR